METIMPVSRKIRVERLGREIEIYDLSVGYLDRAQNDPEQDTLQNMLIDASSLSEEEIAALGVSDLKQIAKMIYELTFSDSGESEDSGSEKKFGKRSQS